MPHPCHRYYHDASRCYLCGLERRIGWHPTVQRILRRLRLRGADVNTHRGLIRAIRRRGMEDRQPPRPYAESERLYRQWRENRAACKSHRLGQWMERFASSALLGEYVLSADQLCSLVGVSARRARSVVLAIVCAARLRGVDPVAAVASAVSAVRGIRQRSGSEVPSIPVHVVWGDCAPTECGRRAGWRWRGRWRGAHGSYIYSDLRVEVGFEWIRQNLDELIGIESNPMRFRRRHEALLRRIMERCVEFLAEA